MRAPSRASSAALIRCATASITSFSTVPCAPRAPCSSPPWPGSITIVRRPGVVDGSGAAWLRRCDARGRRRGRRRHSRTRRSPRAWRRVERWLGSAEDAEPRPELDHQRRLLDQRRAGTRPCDAAPGIVASSRSASKRTTRRAPSCSDLMRASAERCRASRAPAAWRLLSDDDARNAQVAAQITSRLPCADRASCRR